MVMKIQVMVFWVVTLCSDVAGYQCFQRFMLPAVQPEYGGSMVLQKFGILPHY